jgi:hypothetical protein
MNRKRRWCLLCWVDSPFSFVFLQPMLHYAFPLFVPSRCCTASDRVDFYLNSMFDTKTTRNSPRQSCMRSKQRRWVRPSCRRFCVVCWSTQSRWRPRQTSGSSRRPSAPRTTPTASVRSRPEDCLGSLAVKLCGGKTVEINTSSARTIAQINKCSPNLMIQNEILSLVIAV